MRSLLVAVAVLLAIPTVVGVAPSTASAQQRRVLYIPGGSVPGRMRRMLSVLIASENTLVSYDTYARAAREEGLRPGGSTAISRVGTQQNADVIVVATYGGHYRRRTLRMRYFSGSTGELVRSNSHGLRGQHLRPAAQHAILRDIERVAGGGGGGGDQPAESGGGGEGGDDGGDGGDGGLPPMEDWGEEGAEGEGEGDGGGEDGGGEDGGGEDDGDLPLEEQNQWGFSVALGGGIGQRSSNVPTDRGGPTQFSSQPFFALQARAMGYVRPEPSSPLRVALTVRYSTSIGVLVREVREGADDLVTDLRAHHLALGIRTDIPLAPGERPTFLQLELGWQFRMLDLEMPSPFLPDYTLTGLYGRIGLWFYVGDSPISIGLVPEIGHAMNISDSLSQLSQVNDGFMVGAEAHVRLQVIREFALQLLYREAHMFLGSELPDAQLNDAERFVILRAEYRF